MRSFILAILLVGLALQSEGQTCFVKGKNVFIPSNLMVRYTVGTDPCYHTISNNNALDVGCSLFYNQQVNDIFKMLVDAVQTSKVSVFAPYYGSSPYVIDFMQVLSVDEIMHNLGYDVINLNRSDSTGKLETIQAVKPYDISELKGLLFMEEWELNETPFEFTKRIVAYSPIRKFLKVQMIIAILYPLWLLIHFF
jgi:hypothetical protein